MSTFILRLVALAVACVTFQIVTSSAHADEEPETYGIQPCFVNGVHVDINHGSGTCFVVEDQSRLTTKLVKRVLSVNGVNKARVLRYPKLDELGASVRRSGKDVVTLDQRDCFLTSFVDVTGAEVWHRKCYRAGTTFYGWSDGYFHDPALLSKVVGLSEGPIRLPLGATVVKGEVKLVRNFRFATSGYLEINGLGLVTLTKWVNQFDDGGQSTCHLTDQSVGAASYDYRSDGELGERAFRTIYEARADLETYLYTQLGLKGPDDPWITNILQEHAIFNGLIRLAQLYCPPSEQ